MSGELGIMGFFVGLVYMKSLTKDNTIELIDIITV